MTAELMMLPEHVRTRPARRGHAFHPGTGPQGESCGTCRHLTPHNCQRTWHRCGLMRAKWKVGPSTNVLLADPACRKWEAKDAP